MNIHHVILVETMHHLMEAKTNIFRLVNQLLMDSLSQAKLDNNNHYLTVVSFNNGSYKVYWNSINVLSAENNTEQLLSQIQFDSEDAYYKYGCGLYTLNTFIDQTEKELEKGYAKADFHIITDGFDHCRGISWDTVCRRIFEFEKIGWNFSYHYISRMDNLIRKDVNILPMAGPPSLFQVNSFILRKIKAEVMTERSKYEIKKDNA